MRANCLKSQKGINITKQEKGLKALFTRKSAWVLAFKRIGSIAIAANVHTGHLYSPQTSRMVSEPILCICVCITIDAMLNFDDDFDIHSSVDVRSEQKASSPQYRKPHTSAVIKSIINPPPINTQHICFGYIHLQKRKLIVPKSSPISIIN